MKTIKEYIDNIINESVTNKINEINNNINKDPSLIWIRRFIKDYKEDNDINTLVDNISKELKLTKAIDIESLESYLIDIVDTSKDINSMAKDIINNFNK